MFANYFQGLWVNFPKNQLFCLLGPNGAGKTTTINCLTGITPVTGGDGNVQFSCSSVKNFFHEIKGIYLSYIINCSVDSFCIWIFNSKLHRNVKDSKNHRSLSTGDLFSFFLFVFLSVSSSFK